MNHSDADADLSIFPTPQFLKLTRLKRHQLENLERLDVLHPVRPGPGGRGGAARWGFMQAVAAEYYRAFTAAGMHASWARAAAMWVQRQPVWELAMELKAGNTLLSMTPDGEGHLICPRPRPGRTREAAIKLAQLDLGRAFWRVLRRCHDLTGRLLAEAGWTLDEVEERLRRCEEAERRARAGPDDPPNGPRPDEPPGPDREPPGES